MKTRLQRVSPLLGWASFEIPNQPLSMSHSQVIYRLIIPASLWNAAFGELITQRREFAWGRLRRSIHGFTCDLIVDRLRFRRELPNGSELSSLDDWVVIRCPSNSPPDASKRWMLVHSKTDN